MKITTLKEIAISVSQDPGEIKKEPNARNAEMKAVMDVSINLINNINALFAKVRTIKSAKITKQKASSIAK